MLDGLRLRVRAERWGTSGPLLGFGGVTVGFAGCLGAVSYRFVPRPLFWPLCSLVSLMVLWVADRSRRGRSGVGSGRVPYRQSVVDLLGVVVVGNLVWFVPLVKMLLWPGTVLTIMALAQRNTALAWRGAVFGVLMIVGWGGGATGARALVRTGHDGLLRAGDERRRDRRAATGVDLQ